MTARNIAAQTASSFFGLLLLTVAELSTAAEGNIWKSSFGQRWFYETGTAGDLLAGTWWESSLTPRTTYTISFDVQRFRGKLVVLMGNEPAYTINRTGSHSFDFNVTKDGPRRMAFQAHSHDVLGSVNNIVVTPRWHWGDPGGDDGGGGSSGSGGGNWIPKGHYLSFARERNFRTEMVDIMEAPWSVGSWARNQAQGLHDALTTPGVRGFWIEYEWGDVEVGDGRYDWSVIDANMNVARSLGIKQIVHIADRSFDGTNPLPRYFPSRYVLWTSGSRLRGVVSKRWDHYVYSRLIRLHRAIARRYASHEGFGGIATSETALGSAANHSDYSVQKYRHALAQIVSQTQAGMSRGRLFFYLNFIRGGDQIDMNRDARAALLRDVPHSALVVGAPDITPDVPGMPGSATAFRLHAKRTMKSLDQFCHLQHVDHGLYTINVKSNQHRRNYIERVQQARQRERQSWFNGKPGVYEFDDLRDPQGKRVDYHPKWTLGRRWQLDELFHFGRRNFGCDYFLWHYRDYPNRGEFGWDDSRQVILNSQHFYEWE